MNKALAALALAVAFPAGAAAIESATLSGTLTNAAVDDGVLVWFKLIAVGEECTPGTKGGLYLGKTSFHQGKASYLLEGVAAGEYTACFAIDPDHNQARTSGDYLAMKNVTVKGATTLDVQEAEWKRVS